MLDIQICKNKTLFLTFNHEWEGVVYKPFFYRSLNELKQAKNLDEFLEMFAVIEDKKGLKYAFDLLSKRAYSRGELDRKLSEKHLSDRARELVLTRCMQMGYVNDREVALSHIRRELRKGYGPVVFISKLAMKLGMERDFLRQIFHEEVSEEEVIDSRERILEKKFKGGQGVSHYDKGGYLMQRGYET